MATRRSHTYCHSKYKVYNTRLLTWAIGMGKTGQTALELFDV